MKINSVTFLEPLKTNPKPSKSIGVTIVINTLQKSLVKVRIIKENFSDVNRSEDVGFNVL